MHIQIKCIVFHFLNLYYAATLFVCQSELFKLKPTLIRVYAIFGYSMPMSRLRFHTELWATNN